MTATPRMSNNPAFQSLKGQLLIAVPGIDDDRFNQAVVYIYAHTEDIGAQGLVINKPAQKLYLQDVMKQLRLPLSVARNTPVLLGGPDHLTSGFILHTPDYHCPATHLVNEDVSLTATQDILHDISLGKGPESYLMTLGCSSWDKGQLEDELMGNVWLTMPATHQILFHTPFADRWACALRTLGVEAYRLSGTAGKA